MLQPNRRPRQCIAIHVYLLPARMTINGCARYLSTYLPIYGSRSKWTTLAHTTLKPTTCHARA